MPQIRFSFSGKKTQVVDSSNFGAQNRESSKLTKWWKIHWKIKNFQSFKKFSDHLRGRSEHVPGTIKVLKVSKPDFSWSIFRQFLVDFPWFSCYIDLGISRFSRNSSIFERGFLRAQEELEARTTCVRKAWTWSSRKIKHFEKIFSQKKVVIK